MDTSDEASRPGSSSVHADETRASHADRERSNAVRPTIEGGLSMFGIDGGSAPTLPSAGGTVERRAEGERPGGVIGRYKLLQLIGEGGFGSVFLAEQTEPVRRRVALKIIKLGMDTRQVIARFEQERQALAHMDHPSIAKVFDAGATETGRPYFVMEFCPGESITHYCDNKNQSVRGRLELFVDLCHALQHAHQRGLIHRDIKPGNILVSEQDRKPRVKVIDFGIAKATVSPMTDLTLFTEEAQFIGTPQYMSPEQAAGSLDIDTRTDVFSLGVLLYELLTGSTPLDAKSLRSVGHAEIQRIIREVDPPRPSTQLVRNGETLARVAARRGTEPHKLNRVLRGELDWIVMKALEKDRGRRYDSAHDLAADVSRYLAGEAVLAAPPGISYQMAKFVRRHRGAVAGVAVVTAALLLGVVGTTWQARIARQQRDLAEERLREAEATVQFLDDMLGAADPNVQGKDVTVRSVLGRAAKSVEAQFAARPLVAGRLHGTIGRTYMNLGDYGSAEPHLREACALYLRELGAEHEHTCRALNGLAALLIKKSDYSECEPKLVAALAEHERLFGRRHEITSHTIDLLSQLYTVMDRREEAMQLTKELLEIRTAELGTDNIDTLSAMNTLALLLADSERFEEAEKLLERAIAIQDRIGGVESPLALQMRANLAWADYETAMMIKERDQKAYERHLARARALNEDALQAQSRILGEEHPSTLHVMNNLSTVYKELGMFDEADRLAVKDIEISVRVLGETHPDTIASVANMGSYLRARGRFEEAIVYLDRALRAARTSLPADAEGLAFILGWYGSSLRGQGRFAEGEPMLLEAHGIIVRALGEKHVIARRMALDLQNLYEKWHQAEPEKGYDEKAAEWREKAEGYGAASQPAL